MTRNEKRILRELVHYWDGKKFKYKHGPQPPKGDWVQEVRLAEEMGFPVGPPLVLGSDWIPAVGGLDARQLVRQRMVEGNYEEIQPTVAGIALVDEWDAQGGPIKRGMAYALNSWLVPIIIGILGTLITLWLTDLLKWPS